MTNYNILIRLLEAAYLVYVRVIFWGFLPSIYDNF